MINLLVVKTDLDIKGQVFFGGRGDTIPDIKDRPGWVDTL